MNNSTKRSYKTRVRTGGLEYIMEGLNLTQYRTKEISGNVNSLDDFLKIHTPNIPSVKLKIAIEKAYINESVVTFNDGTGNHIFSFSKKMIN